MKEKKKRRLVLTIKIPVIPVACVLLAIGVLWGAVYYALTYGERMLYARHVPKNKESLEIAFVFDKPDEIIYYDGGLFGKKLTAEQRDVVWEAFQFLIVTHGAREKNAMKGWLSGKEVLEKYRGLHCLEFRYEQRRKAVGEQAFENNSRESPVLHAEYDGMLLYLTEELTYYDFVFYKDLKHERIVPSDYGFDFTETKRFQSRMQNILPD